MTTRGKPVPALAQIAQVPDLNNLFALILGGSGAAGIALLIRASTRGGSTGVKSLAEVLVIHERTIKRQQDDLNEEQAAHERSREERRLIERERDHLAILVRYYRARHGDPTDPRMARLVIDEQGNLKTP